MDRILKAKGAGAARRGWLLGVTAAACLGLVAAGIWLYQAKVTSTPPAAPVMAGSPPAQPAPTSPPAPEPVRPQAQPWQAFPQTAAAAFPAMVEKLKRDGYRLHMISPYAVDGTEHYASLGARRAGPSGRRVMA